MPKTTNPLKEYEIADHEASPQPAEYPGAQSEPRTPSPPSSPQEPYVLEAEPHYGVLELPEDMYVDHADIELFKEDPKLYHIHDLQVDYEKLLAWMETTGKQPSELQTAIRNIYSYMSEFCARSFSYRRFIDHIDVPFNSKQLDTKFLKVQEAKRRNAMNSARNVYYAIRGTKKGGSV